MKSEYINCKNCKDDCRCRGKNITPVCVSFKPVKTTNADRIRAMSDEELAFLISNGCPPACVKPCREYLSVDGDTNCTDCWLDWLKSPVEVEI